MLRETISSNHRFLHRFILKVSISLLVGLHVSGSVLEAQPPAGIQEHIYATVGGTPLWLDFLPCTDGSAGPHPLIMFIHGGAWQSGNRQSVPGPILALRNVGFSIATIDYRLTSQAGQFGTEPVTWPAQRDDAKAAVRWLRGHASDLNIQPESFAVWGLSAGGHLAASLALTNDAPGTTGSIGDWTNHSSEVQLGINFYGPSDLLRLDQDVTVPPGSTLVHEAPGSPESLLLRWAETGISMGEILANENNPAEPWQELSALAHDASPMLAVQIDHASPLLIAHGTSDTVIAFRQGEKLHETLVALGLDSQFIPVIGAGHGLPPAVFGDTHEWIVESWAPKQFLRGDTNQDTNLDIADVIVILDHLFQGGSTSTVDCDLAADLNDDEVLDISDAIFQLSWLFGGTLVIPAPYPICGPDPSPGSLQCNDPPPCP